VKSINEVKTHYEKLFGLSTSTKKNELFYQLETNFVKVIEPENGSVYEEILKDKNEGIQILVANPRQKTKLENDAVFKNKGFKATIIDDNNTLFIHHNMPFQIQIKL
jgi:hypothetical protein